MFLRMTVDSAGDTPSSSADTFSWFTGQGLLMKWHPFGHQRQQFPSCRKMVELWCIRSKACLSETEKQT
jgi:hypothetical protein